LYIAPGAPWENGYNESFSRRFRDGLLDRELFTSLGEAKVVVENYRLQYNHRWPHSSPDCVTPATFAARQGLGRSAPPVGTASATLRLPQRAKQRTRNRRLILKATST